MSKPVLVVGNEYSNDEIAQILQCSKQGGMRRSLRKNALVLMSNHTESFYEDEWKGDVLHYTGMGLTGDQKLDFLQNKTLRDSNSNGVDVHLFEAFEKRIFVYQGQVKLVEQPYQKSQRDFNGNLRKVWIFPVKVLARKLPQLVSEDIFQRDVEGREKQVQSLSDAELSNRLLQVGDKISIQQIIGNRFVRNEYVSAFVKRRAKGKCQLCNKDAPFKDKSNLPYLEVHHVDWLSRDGKDNVRNAVALCPNCHRKMHVLDSQHDRKMLSSISNNS